MQGKIPQLIDQSSQSWADSTIVLLAICSLCNFKILFFVGAGEGEMGGAEESQVIRGRNTYMPKRCLHFFSFFSLNFPAPMTFSGYTHISKGLVSFCLSRERIPNILVFAGVLCAKFHILVCIHCAFYPAIVNHLPLLSFLIRNLIYQCKPAFTNSSLLWRIILRHLVSQTSSIFCLITIKQQ